MSNTNKLTPKNITIAFLFLLLLFYFKESVSLIRTLFSVISPFIGGCLFAFLLNIPVELFENKVFGSVKKPFMKKIRRPISVILSLIILLAIICSICFMIAPKIKTTVTDIGEKLPSFVVNSVNYIQKSFDLSDEMSSFLTKTKETMSSWPATFKEITSLILSDSEGAIGQTVSMTKIAINTCLDFIIGFIFSLYLIFEKERVTRWILSLSNKFFTAEISKKINSFFLLLKNNFTKFFKGQCLESFIVAIVFGITTSLFGFKCSWLIALFMLFAAFIPYIGVSVSACLGVCLTIAAEGFPRALLFVGIFIIIQILDGYLLYPKIVGEKVGLPPILVFVSVIIGGALFGLYGMLMAIPIVKTAYDILSKMPPKKKEH